MISSMTGFGRAQYNKEERQYTVEIKSVNNRYCDISVKIPRSISYLEDKVKLKVNSLISRGKVDIFINFYNNSTKGRKITFNNELAQTYILELKKLADENNIEQNIEVTEISKFPDVLTIKNNEDEELIWSELEVCLTKALNNFMETRNKEGKKLYEDITLRINHIEKIVETISKNSTRLIQDYIVKLKTRISELVSPEIIDENRLALETVIYADKSSVEEEITRLRSHISQLRTLLLNENATGKKIDFLIQEMNRETNTIGSKSSSIEITNMVIDIKTELEDIREQVQNIE